MNEIVLPWDAREGVKAKLIEVTIGDWYISSSHDDAVIKVYRIERNFDHNSDMVWCTFGDGRKSQTAFYTSSKIHEGLSVPTEEELFLGCI